MKDLHSSVFVQHVIRGTSLQELHADSHLSAWDTKKGCLKMHALLYSDAEVFFSPMHARISCAFSLSCHLCQLEDTSTIIRFLLQCGVYYGLVLGSPKLTDKVAVYHAIMSQQSSLVN